MTVMLTATPDVSLGMVTLVWSTSPAADVTALWRTDDNGTREVRTLAGLLPASSGVVEDYEAALTGTITYTAVTASLSAQDTASLGGSDTWLTIPVTPAWAVVLDLVTGLTAARASMGTVHEVIDREDPLPTLGGLRKRAGTLSLWCSSWAAARTVVEMHGKRAVLLLRQPDYPGLDLWYVPESVDVEPAPEQTTTRRWLVEVAYREVNPQTGALTGSLARDYADVIAEHTTYLDALATYSTYADLQIGPTP